MSSDEFEEEDPRDSRQGFNVVRSEEDDEDDDNDNDEEGGIEMHEEYHDEPQDGEEEDEAMSLMSGLEYVHDDDDDDYGRMRSGPFRKLICIMTVVLLASILAVALPGIGSDSDTFEGLRTPARIPVEYKCPNEINEAENFDSTFTEDYIEVSNAITDNITEFLQTFRGDNFDNWGHTYKEVKDGMKHFKTKYFPPYLKDGDSIYESACGIGLNLYMTLEILQEAKGIEELFIYGNEYLEVSTEKANAVMDKIAPAHGRKGVICAGDSTDLFFVPDDAFDLVYTGYISPLMDPLQFRLPRNENYELYTQICQSKEKDWKGNKLNEIQQQKQDDWYGTWVAEMSRIAKPGVPVIVEQVSPRYCDAFFDWGGVHRQFWHDAAANNTYGWNVDPESIVIEDDTIFRERYHVFMLKNGHREA